MSEDELRNPESWAMDEAVLREPVKSPRSVISVSSGADDLAVVASAARENGMRTSEFIRTAALAEATRKRKRFDVVAGGASHGVLTVLSSNWRRSGRARFVVRSKSETVEVRSPSNQ